MIWWSNETNFNNWVGKYRKYPIYERQAEEVRRDLKYLRNMNDSQKPTFLDVGGGDGRIGIGTVIDASKGDDITSKETWDKLPMFDVCFTSLVLITLKEEEVDFVISQMKSHTKEFIYLFEERAAGPNGPACGALIRDDFGNKYYHNLAQHLKDFKKFACVESNVSELWEKWIIDI